MTRVLVISHEATLTGAPRVAFELARYLQQSPEFEARLVSQAPGPMQELGEYSALEQEVFLVERSTVATQGPQHTLAEMEKYLRRQAPDVVYANALPSSLWLLAAKRLGLPTILHVHEMMRGLKATLACGLTKLDILDSADGLILASRDCATVLEQLCEPYREADLVLDVFIDPANIDRLSSVKEADARNARGHVLDRRSPIVAMCGTADSRKGTDVFCETAVALPQVQFLWIGPWEVDTNPCEPERIPDNVFVTGAVTNPFYHLNYADAFALTSREDPQPIVVFEALALGKPVVCFSAAGDSKKLLGRYGYVLGGAPEVGRLASALAAILEAGEPRPEWLLAGAREVREQFTAERRLAMVADLIHRVGGGDTDAPAESADEQEDTAA